MSLFKLPDGSVSLSAAVVLCHNPALAFLCRPGVPAVNVISDVLIGGYKGFMACFCFSPLWPQ